VEGQDPATTAGDAAGVAAAAPSRTAALRFTGSGGEYFRIWIVNLLLTVATLGIYSAWAKVRKLRYLYGNTALDGHALGYHGTPRAILRGRAIATVAIAAYLLAQQFFQPAAAALYLAFIVGLPWIIVRARQFSLRVTSWRGVRFDFNSSYGQAAAVYLLGPVLVGLSLGLLLPWFVRSRFRWLIDRSSFGTAAFRSDTTVGPYFGIAFKTLGIALVTLVVTMIGAGMIGVALGVSTPLSLDLLRGGAGAAVLFLVLGYVAIIGTVLVAGAYWRSRTLNYTLGRTMIGPHALRCGLRARRLAFIYATNMIGILLTLGLYTPFAVIRVWRYQAESASVTFQGTADEFIAAQVAVPRATGEELGDLLDVDMGL
jgi:uncharacterized membrane protein YjgN (DUF898 family)